MKKEENKRIKNALCELKEKYGAIAVKVDFSSGFVSDKEISFISDIVSEAGLYLFSKIGGCDALHDIFISKEHNAKRITAPMTESSYAVRKFIDNVFSVYSSKSVLPGINVETIYTYENLEEILSCEAAKNINSLIFGRDDFTASLNINRSEINSDIIYEYALNTLKLSRKYGKKFILGGEIRPQASDFIKKLMPDGYETRSIVFEGEKAFSKNIKNGITKALETEIYLLEYKSKINPYEYDGINKRINNLKQYL